MKTPHKKPRKKSRQSDAPICVFCKRSSGVGFNIFTPRFPPFGTACVECEESLPPGTTVPVVEVAP